MHLNLITAILAACWLATVVMGFFVGFYLQKLRQAVDAVNGKLKELFTDEPATIEETSTLIDMDDPAERAAWEHEQQMRKLNPGLYEDDE